MWAPSGREHGKIQGRTIIIMSDEMGLGHRRRITSHFIWGKGFCPEVGCRLRRGLEGWGRFSGQGCRQQDEQSTSRKKSWAWLWCPTQEGSRGENLEGRWGQASGVLLLEWGASLSSSLTDISRARKGSGRCVSKTKLLEMHFPWHMRENSLLWLLSFPHSPPNAICFFLPLLCCYLLSPFHPSIPFSALAVACKPAQTSTHPHAQAWCLCKTWRSHFLRKKGELGDALILIIY